MEDIWKELILLFGTNGITGWFSWFFARRKANAETDSTLIDNLQQSLAFYQNICDDNQKRLDENQRRLDDMQKRLQESQQELQERQQQLNDALKRVAELQQEVIRLRSRENSKYLELQKELIETRRQLVDKP